ncbi:P-loop NTPase fold protein [Actinokineospora diospyrosa]|uniref:WD domain-containing protein, G-beta repeat-containing protein n=1 Tax=Actinokineospora diospyrosa TaxID=103728 RepID=A0ABT1I895_9PSEU|nr:P-loop NTPase fold protein [Actinokineospora diospyrosa]MCP2268776.1 WD domain-containing protein, G-beta repeat-containing protein [Actinokineospora diospyrosa]
MAPQQETRLHIPRHSGALPAPLLSLLADSGTVLVHSPAEADLVLTVDQVTAELKRAAMAPLREQRVIEVGSPVTSVAFVETEPPMVVAGCEDGVARVWSLDGTPRRELRGHVGPVWGVAASRYAPGQVFTCGQDGTVRGWSLYGEQPGIVLHQHEGIANTIAAGRGPSVISGGDDNRVLRWTNGSVVPLGAHDDFVIGVTLLDEATPVSISHDRTLRLWDYPTGPAPAPDPTGSPYTCVVGHGSRLYAGTEDGLVTEVQAGTALAMAARPASLAAATPDGPPVVAIGGVDGLIRVWEPESGALTNLPGHAGPVSGVAFGTLDDRPVLLSGGADGTIRLWARPMADQIEWTADAPAAQDLLRRQPLARLIADQLRGVDSSFLVHLDGPWGSGKSTVLGFVREELERDFTVVPFDAWREAGVGPAWWALLTALRTAIRGQRGFRGRLALRISESFARLKRVGAPVALAFAVLLALGAGIWWLFASDLKTFGEIVKSVTGAVAGVGTVVAGALVASRFLLWDSARGAKLFEQSNTNPMLEVNRHFGWLAAKTKRPVVFLVDDLDRCKESYVVDLLDSVQTLVRDIGPHFVVAADGAWIRASYEQAYQTFTTAVAEPGRPLGYLFLDKFFQLRVPIPSIDPALQEGYLSQLLGTGTTRPAITAEETRVRDELAQSSTEAQVVATMSTTSQEVRDRVATEALRRITTPEAIAATEHVLQRYAKRLPKNPRAMKRFINTYSMVRAVRTLEGNPVPVADLALWTILEIRWPSLADHLRTHPDTVEQIGTDDLDTIPEPLRPLFTDPALVDLTRTLNPDAIRACCGT